MYAPPAAPQQSNNKVLWIVLAVLAVAGCAGCAVFAAILFPVFSQARLAATRTMALSNVKQTSLGLIMYSADNNDCLPPAGKWMDLTESYTKNQQAFVSPAVKKLDPSGYGFAFRKELSQKKTASVDSIQNWAMVFDSTLLTRNAFSGLETIPNPGRYSGINVIGFGDGHAKMVKASAMGAIGPDGKPIVR